MDKVFLLIDMMNGGGAERVISLLASGFAAAGHKTCVVLTRQQRSDTVWHPIRNDVEVVYLNELIEQPGYRLTAMQARRGKLGVQVSRQLRKLANRFGREWDTERIMRFTSFNAAQIRALRVLFGNEPGQVIAFLNYSVFLALLTAGKDQRLIISERGDPEQNIGNPTTMAFIRRRFSKAAHMVFQSPGAMEWYTQHSNVSGTVIPNPLTTGLPEPWEGERTKEIVNFCRLSPQKNIPLLVRAFGLLHKNHPEYRLVIYGNEDAETQGRYTAEILRTAEECDCIDAMELRPFQHHIHDIIRSSAMFVSSSDFEGLSNSMIEAMAIGLPAICTDCPAGGARYMIQDHENGLLVPMNDAEALCGAMREVIESKELSRKLSQNGVKVRELLEEQRIIKRWRELE